ncbi:hypothetical protein PGT21_002471 [Puccinia graminis f. sp. tritici]|uniref:SCP domain-containing protein n=2 Tax=Puccinia graminis f. sp. tritici TaxID=56615 RepID=E3KBJ8_PUCGT|nr:uncharacterized protein PGTG_07743 [Puccinia graminis f. sp. tritici CRL 75-36-700-3]EFP81494.1 hypothetical protein PGTG_07743 [Puccinia graminis f. sp. tritici CRL 75-36-700-3]KAA1109904.1 hypothetical protein PGT21_002471 [Puccinia graminis f. sp. tritici]
MITYILLLTSILLAPGQVANWSIPGAPQHKPLHAKRHSSSMYNWEQSWNSQTNNQITTITTSTSGTIPPDSGLHQGAASTWSYQYCYSSSSDDNQDNSAASFGDSSSTFPASQSGAGSDSGFSDEFASVPGSSNTTPVVNSPPKPVRQEQTYSPPKPSVEVPSIPKDLSPTPQPKYANVTKSPGLPRSSALSAGDTSRYSSTKSDSPSLLSTPNPESTDNKEDKKESSRLPALSDSDTGGTKKLTPSPSGSHQDWLDSHNNYRSQYGVKSLTWSEDLVEAARSEVEKCVWKHTKHNQYGENIAAGQNSPSEVVVAWVEGPNERDIFSPDSATPTHFTQVVWKETEQIGCAVKSCETIEGSNLPQAPVKLWACEYHPKGNVGGQYAKNVLAAAGGKPLAAAGSSAFASVDPDDPSRAKAGGSGLSRTTFFPAPE